MEKKTIGKFISVLRKANGLTQKELAEKLYVSDKTVSRWECDECTPELSLIPVIAELFGVTADELLRGERNSPAEHSAASDTEAAAKQQVKSDKAFRSMLSRRVTKFKYLSLISIGIAIAAIIAAVICNTGLNEAVIGFWISCVFVLGSVICQTAFAVNARLAVDEDDSRYESDINKTNNFVADYTLKVYFLNILVIAFILPLVIMVNHPRLGLEFDVWMLYSLGYVLSAFVIVYTLYAYIIRKLLCSKGVLSYNEKETAFLKCKDQLLTKTLAVFLVIELILAAAFTVITSDSFDVSSLARYETFDNYEDFQKFMRNGAYSVDLYGNLGDSNDVEIFVEESIVFSEAETGSDKNEPEQPDTDEKYPLAAIKDADGNIVCEYVHNALFYVHVEHSFDVSEDGLPLKVLTQESLRNARALIDGIRTVIIILALLDFAVCAAVYCRKVSEKRKELFQKG